MKYPQSSTLAMCVYTLVVFLSGAFIIILEDLSVSMEKSRILACSHDQLNCGFFVVAALVSRHLTNQRILLDL